MSSSNTTILNERALDNVSKRIIRNQNSFINSSGTSPKDISNKSTYVDLSAVSVKDSDDIPKLFESYKNKVIVIPIATWVSVSSVRPVYDERNNTQFSNFMKSLKNHSREFKKNYEGFVIVFTFDDESGKNDKSFVVDVNNYENSDYKIITRLIDENTKKYYKSISHGLTGSADKNKSATVKDKDTTKEDNEKKKKQLVDKISTTTLDASTEEEAYDAIDNDEEILQLLKDLEETDSNKPKLSAARTNRMAKLNDDFLNSQSTNSEKTVSQMLLVPEEKELPKVDIPVDSINDEWHEMQFTSFQSKSVYDIDSDIYATLEFLSTLTYPISIKKVEVTDTSTSMDYVNTWRVETEDSFGTKATLLFDIPQLTSGRFMRLRGNDKSISGQLVLLPCLKTDNDTVQIVTNYNKIFIRRHGAMNKSFAPSDRLIKSLNKYKGSDIKVFVGDNSRVCSLYELPVDYIDLAGELDRIETKELTYYFNQKNFRQKYKIDKDQGIPYAVSKKDGSVLYYKDNNILISSIIAEDLCAISKDFAELYSSTKSANRLMYSEASIMSTKMPLAVTLGYSYGLTRLLKRAGINYHFSDTRSKHDPDRTGVIKFEDGYMYYDLTYESSILLNGLKECDTENYRIVDMDKMSTWLDFLDNFGGRILSDGLDNFKDLLMDPITIEVCHDCKLPDDYMGILIYANNLLADNKYNKHTDISGNRYRTSEIIAGYTYKAISKSYADYRKLIKMGKRAGISIKRSAVIDLIFKDPMTSDLSYNSAIQEVETANTVSFKGLSGMNSDRAYGLDKRTYDETMLNKLSMSTGFASNVGISRQATIDMDIEGRRGYIKNSGEDEMSVTKTFSMAEALTPFGTSRETI